MCDPSIMGIASMASGMADAFGQQSAQREQEKAYKEWMAMQDKNRAEETAAQEKLRLQAEAARTQTVNKLSGSNVTKELGNQAGQLTDKWTSGNALTHDFPATDAASGTQTAAADATLLQPGDPAVTNAATGGQTAGVLGKYMLQGQGELGAKDPQFMADLAGKLSGAASAARKNIGYLSTMSAYGGGFEGFTDDQLMKSGMTIDEINNFRNGRMKVYGAKQAVDPKQIVYQKGFL